MAPSPHPDAAVASVAGRQHGLITRRQAIDLGLSEKMVDQRLRWGTLVPVTRGLYRVTGFPFTWQTRLMAAVLPREEAVVSGRAAAALHRFEGFGPCRPEITVPLGTSGRSTLAVVRRRTLAERTTVDNIPCTTIAQTVVDLAGRSDSASLTKAVDLLLSQRRLALPQLEHQVLLATARQLAGTGRLHDLIERYDDGVAVAASVLEHDLHELLREIGATGWRAQARAPWSVDGSELVDVLVERKRLILEADGRAWHTRAADFENDRRRDNLAARFGYRVLRFTARALRAERASTTSLLLDVFGLTVAAH